MSINNANIKIGSVQGFLDQIFDITKIEDKIPTYRHYFYFRGQANSNWDIIPTIGRNRRQPCHISILDEERNLIEAAKFELPEIFNDNILPLDLLATLQHYGVPTRLLDITKNPLVALYFACTGKSDSDGEVIVFHNQTDSITNYPIIHGISETYKFAFGTFTSLELFYKNVVNQPYFNEQKSSMPVSKNKEKWINDCCSNLFFVQSKAHLNRQKLQQGAYILFNNDISEDDGSYKFNKLISPIPKNHKNIKGRIIIDLDKKKEILNQLNLLGISEATLFADNTDIVCKNIAQRFSV